MYRVLVVDDSAVFRNLLRHAFEDDPSLRVVGEAVTGAQAVELAQRLKPDVITMDISMPVTDGLDAIRRIMTTNARPIVVVSGTFDSTEVSRTFEAMEAGAVAAVPKPPGPDHPGFASSLEEIVTTVKLMSEVKVVNRRRFGVDKKLPPIPSAGKVQGQMVAIAASTGGPAALEMILRNLPSDLSVPVVVVQHIAPGFEQGLVDWLQGVSPLRITLASAYQPLRPGEVVISRNGHHLVVSRQAVMMRGTDPVDGHCPSATALFSSVASSWGSGGVGVILTGMGRDGTKGLVEMKKAGGYVIAQDEATSVVYGMPAAAKQSGAVDVVLALNRIPEAVVQACAPKSQAPRAQGMQT